MTLRPTAATSERQLLMSLRESGRLVSAAQLANWRKDGLLPPLLSHGLGTAKGKSHVWHDPAIFMQAQTVFDLTARDYRTDETLWMLWLYGFSVPMARLRRAWLHRARAHKPWRPQPADYPAASLDDEVRFHPEWMLLEAICRTGATYPVDDRAVCIFEAAFARLGRSNWAPSGQPRAIWGTLQMFAGALAESTMLADARNEELNDTQRYLVCVAALLNDVAGEDSAWQHWLAEEAGATVAFIILALIKCGQRELLEALLSLVEIRDRPEHPQPVLAALHSV